MKRTLSSCCGLFAALLMLPTSTASAVEGRSDGRPDWIPYIEIAVDLHKDDVRSEVNTTPATSGVAVFERWAEKKNYRNTPLGFSGRIGLLAPPFESLPGKPRFFLDAGVYATPETKETILETGNLDLAPTNFTSSDNGQGSRIDRRFQNPAGGVGFGMEFTLPWVDERFRLKPSVEYSVEKVEIQGKFTTLAGAAPNILTFKFDERVDDVYHHVGLGLEGEFVVTGGLSLYLDTRLLWLVTDDKLSFSNAAIEWVYERQDSPAFHGAFGFRYSFLGF